MKHKILLLLGFTIIGTCTALGAETEATLGASSSASEEVVSSPVESSAPRWKAAANSHYYNFEGTQAATDNLYSFGSSTLFMQLVSLQYEVSPGWTILALGQHLNNYVETTMPIPNGPTLKFQDKTMGWGDVLIDVIHPIYMSSSFMLFGDAGISLPTGSINKKNASNPSSNYAYNMQLGSGTPDIQVGTVAMYLNPHFQVGTHLNTFQRIGENRNGYRLGNLYRAQAWFDVPAGYGFTPRLVSYYKVKQAIHGHDKSLGRNVYTEYYHHDQTNWDVSAALKFERKLIGSAMLVAEAGKPLFQGAQNVDKVIVSTNYYGTVGVSGTF